MKAGKDYLLEVQKFVTSQYWNSGFRITAGVMVPLLVLVQTGRLAEGIPFLWGALFVSLTDTPGPIHHRRNGMIAAIILNTIVVLITTVTKEHQAILIVLIVAGGFLLSMGGIYGGRAGAVGTLALVLMLLNLLSVRSGGGAAGYNNVYMDGLLVGAGGLWYMIFSLILYRLMPYRVVEQALGENLLALADYIRARASFYKEGADLQACYTRVMESQIAVQKIQDQTQELLFKTRKFVADASPKSRSSMMIYLESLDLLEEIMYSYQDYQLLHKTLNNTGLLNKLYGLILQLAAGLEHVGFSIQAGLVVRRNIDLNVRVSALQDLVRSQPAKGADIISSLETLNKTLTNIQNISNRINRIVLFTRLEGEDDADIEMVQKINKVAVTQPLSLKLFREHLTLKSNTFRHALRLTAGMVFAYGIALVLSLHHAYWVLLTIVTILKPVYSVTRKRNISRVAGTLIGILVVSLVLFAIESTAVLLAIMIVSMLIGYSLLRVNYFGFVVFLTVFVIISFHFLNPFEFKNLIRERLIDTVIGSVIAFLASRYIFPVWGHEEIHDSMRKMLEANRRYFSRAWLALKTRNAETVEYEAARKDAVVTLSNLSNNFQQMLAEPRQSRQSEAIHQFVIASHMLTSHIAALSAESFSKGQGYNEELEAIAAIIEWELQRAEEHLKNGQTDRGGAAPENLPIMSQTLGQLSMILALARDVSKVTRSF